MPMIEFKREDGSSCKGYLSKAKASGKPSVIVLQEWWGVNEHMCNVADRFAAAEFNALVPDLFDGRVTQDPDEASHLMNGLDFEGAVYKDIRGAVKHMKENLGAQKVAVVGFCMGGALTIASAVHLSEVSAAVCFYGFPDKEFADPANIRIPFQGHFAAHDTWASPELVNQAEAALKTAGQHPDIYSYDAQHAFFNEMRPEVFDAEAASLAWGRTLDFLSKHPL